jgi:hypothetical protein
MIMKLKKRPGPTWAVEPVGEKKQKKTLSSSVNKSNYPFATARALF